MNHADFFPSLYQRLTPEAHRIISLIDDEERRNFILNILNKERFWMEVEVGQVNEVLNILGLKQTHQNWISLFN
jgi:hypothetical protein